ncbi:MAG: LPS export ABC transporter periplasmic protein LptC [Candidatus Krumholzibacteriia bacterium]
MRWPARVLYYTILLGFLVVSCANETPDEIAFEKRELPDEVFSDFVTQESDSGMVMWKLKAPRANRFSKKKLVLLENPVIEFFDKEGNLKTTLVSEVGEYSEESQDMLAFGDVVVESTEGDVLETDSLLWKNGEDKIVSNSWVRLTRGNDLITGVGLECAPDLSFVDIKRDVQVTIIDTTGASIE